MTMDRTALREHILKAIASNEAFLAQDHQLMLPDGTLRPCTEIAEGLQESVAQLKALLAYCDVAAT